MLLEKLNKIWTVVGVAMTCCIAYQIQSAIRFVGDAKKHNFPSNSLSDLSEMVVSIFFLAIFRIGMDKAIRNWIHRRMIKFEGDKLTEVKFEKTVRSSVSLVWYTFATLYGYYLLKGHHYVPTPFLGSCTCKEIFSGWPYYKTDGNVRTFYMVMLSHHFYSLVELYWSARKRPDAPEMYLHHIATVSLMLFSYYTNHIPAGLTLLVAHNVGDIMLNLTKAVRDLRLTSNPILQLLIAFSMILSYFVPRVVLISSCIVPVAVNYFIKQMNNDWEDFEKPANQFFDKYYGVSALQGSMILVIVVLNIHWSFMMLNMLYNTLVNKRFEVKIKGGEGY